MTEMNTAEDEDEFAQEFASMSAKSDARNPGVRVDLAKHVCYFPEELASISAGRSRKKKRAET